MKWQDWLPTNYQWKVSLTLTSVRAILLLLVFFTYYFILKTVPANLAFHLELSIVLVGTVSILFFLPLVEQIGRRLRKEFLTEYLSEDEEGLRQGIKQFDVDSLIRSVFPDMVKISGSQSGTLAILNHKGTFEFHSYFKGRQKKILPSQEILVKIKFQEFLKNRKEGARVSEVINDQEINEDFLELHSNFVHPFLFRETLFGFIALSNIPTDDSLISISLLAGQAALTIHNSLLSNFLSDNLKYRKEAEHADKIQNLLETGPIPFLPGWEIDIFQRSHGNLIEFFNGKDNSTYLLVLNAGKSSQHVGIVLSYLIGLLFSQSRNKTIKSFQDIKSIIQQTFLKLEWKERYEYLIGKFDGQNLYLLQEGVQFKIARESDPKEIVVSIGWKNQIQFQKGAIFINYQDKSILKINHKKTEIPK